MKKQFLTILSGLCAAAFAADPINVKQATTLYPAYDADGDVIPMQVTHKPYPAVIPAKRNSTSDAYAPSSVQTKLNVEIKEGTNAVHFIRDNSDAYVVSKAYLLNNADPFILRGVLRTIVAGAVSQNPVAIESIKYVDGRGVILVSAEEYRFKNAGNGMSMDDLVAALDKKNLPNSSGTVDLAYFPKYNSAAKLLEMMYESGIGVTVARKGVNAVTYSGYGLDINDMLAYALADEELNAIIMTAPGFDISEAQRFLKAIDIPTREIKFSYKLVEVYAENDQKLGLDFQAWKNNDGLDLFTVGGVYSTNWAGALAPNNGTRNIEYYNFNPKWNTKYVDFLTTCGKAKVVSSGSLNIADRGNATLSLTDGLFTVTANEIRSKDAAGKLVKHTIKRLPPQPATEKTLNASGEVQENVVGAYGTYLEQVAKEVAEEVFSVNIHEGRTQETEAVSGNIFSIALAGDVHCNAANLEIGLTSCSLIGWDAQGKARMANSSFNTQIQIGNQKKEFVIGGLTKSSVVRSVTGLPILKDIPVLGWLFSTETDAVKKSQFVLIATAEPVEPADTLPKEIREKLDKTGQSVREAEKNPVTSPLGFQQYGIDTKEIK